ncbi:hypothetical protein B0H16DRAFT_1471836 [Mycena metata]|uniref:Uncharacterized protein n=1 Tax=Mycena metata TaxID=1033252 RepID=A0AAD7MNY5_9AGAR|nr:hypothetical protein B0H16DRAFT_1471836 [Mycena metata]
MVRCTATTAVPVVCMIMGIPEGIDVVKGLQQLFEAVVYMTVIIGVLGVGVGWYHRRPVSRGAYQQGLRLQYNNPVLRRMRYLTHRIGVWLARISEPVAYPARRSVRAHPRPRGHPVAARGPERNNDNISVTAWADEAILAHARVHDPDIPPREVYLDSGAQIGLRWGVEIEGIGPEVSNTPAAESG